MAEAKAHLDFADVRYHLSEFDSGLAKPYQRGPEARAEAIKDCNLAPDLEATLASIDIQRDGCHLIRMLTRSAVERVFAIGYLQYSGEIYGSDPAAASEINDVICSESRDTQMFWTFAPYIFKALKEKGVAEREAMQKVLLWAKSGGYLTDENCNRNNLKGLEVFEQRSWFLRKDPADISHQFTEQEAERVADLLMEEGSMCPQT